MRLLKALFSRFSIVVLLVSAQISYFIITIFFLAGRTLIFYWIFQLISIFVVIWICSKRTNPEYKIAWIIPIMAFPVVGGVFYLYFGSKRLGRRVRENIKYLHAHDTDTRSESTEADRMLHAASPLLSKQAYYIAEIGGTPVSLGTAAAYLKLGEDIFEQLKVELNKAERFIFMEYFIIERGEMWDAIFDILRKKAARGVEIRLIYDYVGTVNTLPTNYHKQITAAGISVVVFNPFGLRLSSYLNHRDHRKICVIDGNIGFTGGANMADEYINAAGNLGHWKDTGVMLKGDAVYSLTKMFLSMWDFSVGSKTEAELYRPTESYPSDGFVQPFCDSPLDSYKVSECVYLQAIFSATRYIYITTPYLILGSEMMSALCLAAQSGVDVRIITPHKPDKWFVHAITRGNYMPLLKSGVKIYEYAPGFMHAKMLITDDHFAVVGTVNMDFRSFHLHFECACAFYLSTVIGVIKNDFMRIQNECIPITHEDELKTGIFTHLLRAVLNLFSPLM